MSRILVSDLSAYILYILLKLYTMLSDFIPKRRKQKTKEICIVYNVYIYRIVYILYMFIKGGI